MAPSLDALDGKKLFLVDVGFANSDNFMAQLHGWFEDHRPAIRTEIVRWQEPAHPRPGALPSESRRTVTRPSSASGPDRAARRRSPATSSISSRSTEFPPWAYTSHVFAHLVRNTVKSNGMPNARQAFVPTPLLNTSPAGLREYVEGDDPIHGRPFMAEVFDQLTRPVPADELGGEQWDRSTSRYVEADSEAEMHALFQERRYTDFLPMSCRPRNGLSKCSRARATPPDEMVGKLRPTIGMEYWHFDVEKVAVNAVMAGAAPSTCRSSSRSPRAATRGARAACPRWGTWSSSTGRSATRSE